MASEMLLKRQEGAGEEDAWDGFQFYYYSVSMPAAIIFAVLFGITTVLHLWQMIHSRTWFMVPFVLGAIFETIGYIGRIISATENDTEYTLGPYVIQNILLLVAPALFAASVYMELARIVQMADGDSHLFIRRTWVTKIFVTFDVISFMMQGAGGGIMSSGDASSAETGEKVIIGGLIVQIVAFGFFVIVSGIWQWRMKKVPTQCSFEVPWKKHMLSLYLVSALILVRSLVRLIEFIQGFDGHILSHEVYLYIFDALLMFAAVVVFNVIHPSEVKRIIRSQEGMPKPGDPGYGEHDGTTRLSMQPLNDKGVQELPHRGGSPA